MQDTSNPRERLVEKILGDCGGAGSEIGRRRSEIMKYVSCLSDQEV